MMDNEDDKLRLMYGQQAEFMKLLREKRGFPAFPLDLSEKSSQKFIKSIAFDAMGELFEAVQELKNSKGHRATEIDEFDREAYVEELVDTQHFLFEILLLSGVSLEEFFAAYMKKGDINEERIRNGY
jgi:hypothetical protein